MVAWFIFVLVVDGRVLGADAFFSVGMGESCLCIDEAFNACWRGKS